MEQPTYYSITTGAKCDCTVSLTWYKPWIIDQTFCQRVSLNISIFMKWQYNVTPHSQHWVGIITNHLINVHLEWSVIIIE